MKKNILSLLLLVNLANADFIRDDEKSVVIDTATRLMWQDDASVTKDWEDAITHCEALTLGDYSDWHLANFNELHMLVDRSTYNPSISSAFINVVSSHYWSSTTNENIPANAWVVNFDLGESYPDPKTTDTFYVRCVRSADND
ncbi:MAG: DUF1566 domain-containing protein [Arcobacteraceae bacterium]|nr:DUF1566 domain-containing protein [Arcobacteraceae bacterium]